MGEVAVVAQDVIPGHTYKLCCIYLELLLSILRTQEPTALIPYHVQLRIWKTFSHCVKILIFCI